MCHIPVFDDRNGSGMDPLRSQDLFYIDAPCFCRHSMIRSQVDFAVGILVEDLAQYGIQPLNVSYGCFFFGGELVHHPIGGCAVHDVRISLLQNQPERPEKPQVDFGGVNVLRCPHLPDHLLLRILSRQRIISPGVQEIEELLLRGKESG